jgi:hypothetical protein
LRGRDALGEVRRTEQPLLLRSLVRDCGAQLAGALPPHGSANGLNGGRGVGELVAQPDVERFGPAQRATGVEEVGRVLVPNGSREGDAQPKPVV